MSVSFWGFLPTHREDTAITSRPKKKKNSICIRGTATEGRKSEIYFKTTVLITDTRVQVGNKILLG